MLVIWVQLKRSSRSSWYFPVIDPLYAWDNPFILFLSIRYGYDRLDNEWISDDIHYYENNKNITKLNPMKPQGTTYKTSLYTSEGV